MAQQWLTLRGESSKHADIHGGLREVHNLDVAVGRLRGVCLLQWRQAEQKVSGTTDKDAHLCRRVHVCAGMSQCPMIAATATWPRPVAARLRTHLELLWQPQAEAVVLVLALSSLLAQLHLSQCGGGDVHLLLLCTAGRARGSGVVHAKRHRGGNQTTKPRARSDTHMLISPALCCDSPPPHSHTLSLVPLKYLSSFCRRRGTRDAGRSDVGLACAWHASVQDTAQSGSHTGRPRTETPLV